MASGNPGAVQFVHIYHTQSGRWDGDWEPVKSLRVVDDEAFKLGNANPQEGGPKGVDICQKNQILVATSESEPISFYRIDQIVAEIDGDSSGALLLEGRKDEPDAMKTILIRELEATRQDGNRLQLAIEQARSSLAMLQEAHHALSGTHHALSQSHHILAGQHHALAQQHHELAQQHHKLMVQPWCSVVLPECMRILRSILPIARFPGGTKKS